VIKLTYLFKIAFKNIYRHKLRTLVSIIAIAFSVMIVVFARGFIVGMIDSFFADHIQYNSGHIKIINKEYEQQERLLALNYPVNGFNNQGVNNMIIQLEKIENVDMVIPRIKFGAMSTTEEDFHTMMGWGVNPEKETQFTNIEKNIIEGRMIEPKKMEVILGEQLLRKLDKNVGDKITFLYNTSYNSLKGATFKVVGKVRSGLKMLDETVFYLPLKQAQRLLYMDEQVTELLLVTPNRSMAKKVLPQIKDILNKNNPGKYLALSYRETSDILPFMEIAKLIYNQIYIFLVLLASFVVINTMMMIVKERTREIGMMSALGLESNKILQLFMIEGAIMGIVGSFLGALSGGILVSFLATKGINFSHAISGMSSEILFNSTIYPVSSTGNVIFAFILGIIIVTIAAMFPARKAARLEPTEALRKV